MQSLTSIATQLQPGSCWLASEETTMDLLLCRIQTATVQRRAVYARVTIDIMTVMHESLNRLLVNWPTHVDAFKVRMPSQPHGHVEQAPFQASPFYQRKQTARSYFMDQAARGVSSLASFGQRGWGSSPGPRRIRRKVHDVLLEPCPCAGLQGSREAEPASLGC